MLPRREFPVAGTRCRIETSCASGGVPHSWVNCGPKLWSTCHQVIWGASGHTMIGLGADRRGSGAYLIRPARAEEQRSQRRRVGFALVVIFAEPLPCGR